MNFDAVNKSNSPTSYVQIRLRRTFKSLFRTPNFKLRTRGRNILFKIVLTSVTRVYNRCIIHGQTVSSSSQSFVSYIGHFSYLKKDD